jgi:ADP-L-glycero-D-manno-heptose 6-epimerase
LAKALFAALEKKPDIRYIPMPEDLREAYQYFTQADMGKLRAAGYEAPFWSLEDATTHYVQNFLLTKSYY